MASAKKSAPASKKTELRIPESKNPRAMWTGTVSFGLITIPVKLHAAARGESVSFNMLHADCLGRVKQKLSCPTCDVEIQRNETVKGYEYETDQYVVIAEDELESIKPESQKVMEFADFIPADELDPMLFENSYYVTPGDGGLRGYHLVRRAMVKTGRVGVTKITMASREHLVVIRPYGDGLSLHTLYYQAEIPAITFPADQLVASEKELKLAAQLIESLGTDFEHAAYSDTYMAAVDQLIKDKLAGKQIVSAPKKAAAKVTTGNDMLAVLEASLAKTKRKSAAGRAIMTEGAA